MTWQLLAFAAAATLEIAGCFSVLAWPRQAGSLRPAMLGTRLGAANHAVVYQGESGKRTLSPVLWQRILALRQGGHAHNW